MRAVWFDFSIDLHQEQRRFRERKSARAFAPTAFFRAIRFFRGSESSRRINGENNEQNHERRE
jgi:hypothetical protein